MENNNIANKGSISALLTKYLVILCSSIIFAFIFHNVWTRYLVLYHTILELICVFIAFSIFVSIWYTYNRNTLNTCILGFGFLLIAIFDAIHAFYFLKLNLIGSIYFDLSTSNWIFGRVIGAIGLFLFTMNFKKNINKWAGLIITLMIGCGISCFTIVYHDLLSILLAEKGISSFRVVLELILIPLYTVGLYRMKDKINDRNSIKYAYVFQSILLNIPLEISFALQSSANSIIWTIGHILKIVSYFCLYKGIFVNSIIYSYERLELEHEKLEKAHGEINSITDTLNDILDALPVGVFMQDSNHRVAYINKKIEDMLECSRSNLKGMKIDEVYKLFPKVKKRESDFQGLEIGDKSVTCKCVGTYKISNGNYRKLSIESNEIRNGFLSLVRDAKEQQELKNLNLQTETILNSVTNGVLMIDNDKKVILCNKAMEEIYEMDRKNIIGMNIDELNKATSVEEKELPELVLNGVNENQMYEVSLTTFKGNKKELMLYLASIKNVDGEIIGAISVSTDVTEFNKQKLKMQQQEKLALMGQLGAGIVHETRNYLTTIKGRCQLIELIAENEKVKKYSKRIDEDVTEVNRIISEFLFLSKPRETELQEVSMYDIFEAIKNIVESSSLVKGVNVNMKLSKEERYLLCDEVQIKQVILNICKNAVDAMTGVTSPELTVETGYNELQNNMYIIIRDNGIGMTEEQLKKIGTMFYTTKSTGTGLGLNVCFQIIKEHNGHIEVESKPNEGTTFTITLPCIEDEDIDDAM